MLSPPLTSVGTSQGDELITSCTYNTENRSNATVVSVAMEGLKSVQTGLNQKQGGVGKEVSQQGYAACSWDAKVLIEK